MKYAIASIDAQEILDSRGNPTVEVTVALSNGVSASAQVPSGASTGTFEAHELRDGDPARYGGRGVLTACANVREQIAPALTGQDVTKQQAIDEALRALDGTPNKARLGANAILGVSLASARAAAEALHLPLFRSLRRAFDLSDERIALPTPMLNIVNGGRHADNGLDFQEYMVVPKAEAFAERMRCAATIYAQLALVLKQRKLSTLVGDEGGFAPPLPSNRAPFELLVEATQRAGYAPHHDVAFAIDPAASEFFGDDGAYHLTLEDRRLSSAELVTEYEQLVRDYPLVSIEDGLAEEDWAGWATLTERLGGRTMLVGDDLFVTNVERFRKGIAQHVANAILIKVNQIGTLSETIDAIRLAQEHRYQFVISHRSGDTNDAFIADLAVAVGAPYIKAGAPARSERLSKYNRLLEIEHVYL